MCRYLANGYSNIFVGFISYNDLSKRGIIPHNTKDSIIIE